ncbi:MAG: hypothetical protein ACK4HB_02360 [Candidatus Bipolaricaulia bacterium]
MAGPIIRNPEVLSEEHLPEQVIHRFNQLKVVAEAVEPLLHGKSSKTVLMHGPSGSGKTTTARFLLDKLKEQDSAIAQGLGLPKIIGKISGSYLKIDRGAEMGLDCRYEEWAQAFLDGSFVKGEIESPCSVYR